MKTIQQKMPELENCFKAAPKYLRPQLDVFMAEHQLSQKEFADLLEVAPSTVNNWLKTDALPQILTMQLMCEKFNLSQEEFWQLFRVDKK